MKRLSLWLVVSGFACANVNTQALEERVTKLEQENSKNAEAMEFLRTAYEGQRAQRDAEAARQHAPDAVFAINIAGSPTLGPADAPVTIVEAWDFACPYCMRMTPMLHETVKKYAGQVRVAFKNFVIHPETATTAHLAGCAAQKQGKFNEFVDAFWRDGFTPYMESQGRAEDAMGRDNIVKIAAKLGLDKARFASDLDSPACRALLASDQADMERFGVSATPTVFVNGTFAALDAKGGLDALIDKKLAEAKASGVPAAQYYDKVVMAGETKFRSGQDPKPAK